LLSATREGGGGFEVGTNSGLDQLEDLADDLASRIDAG
jgi:hypothetical protein